MILSFFKKLIFEKINANQMKKKILLTLFVIYSFNFYAQTSFEKGYFIKNSGEKIECLIKNLDLLNNPKSFTYKTSENSKEIKAFIDDVELFEIYNVSKYERHTVAIDRSSEQTNKLSLTRKVKFNTEQLFLKLLVEGKASLYYYSEPNLSRFFYSNNDDKVRQLVYKSYLTESGDIKKNQRFRQQLLDNFYCKNTNKIKTLRYRKSDLSDFFIDYNICVASNFTDYTFKNIKTSKSQFNLNVRAGFNVLSFEIKNITFETKTVPRFGLELEYIMGFNNNKWAFIIEPSYFNYSSRYNDTTERITDANNSAVINYSAIDLPLGLRHYMFLNNNSKLFINGAIVPNLTLKSEIRSINKNVNNPLDFDGESDINYALGLGYKYKDKFSVELRYSTVRDLINQFATIDSSLGSTALILGYTLF